MNKIKIDKEIDKILTIDKSTTIDINSNSRVFIFIKNNIDIDFNITSDSTINIFTISTSSNINLNLNKENIKVNYNYYSINKKKDLVKENIYHNKNGITSNIKNHGLNIKNKLIFSINTIVGKNIKDSICNQDSIIITDDIASSSIKPNMIIDNNDIDANHSAYIGRFKDEDIFYFMSRSIDINDAKKILAKAFLVNDNMKYNEKDFIYKKLNDYWR